MPTAEEVLIRLRAEADESIQEIDRTTERVQELKAEAGSIDLDTSKATEALGELEGALERSKESLVALRDGGSSATTSTSLLADSQIRLSTTLGLAALAGASLKVQLGEIERAQEAVSSGVEVLADDYPELAAAIKSVGGRVKDFLIGPLALLNRNLETSIERWKESRRVFEPALEALIEKGEDAQSRVEALFDEIRSGEGDLRRTQSELLLAAQGLERTGEASDATRIQVFNLATSLREDLRAAGVEVSESLNELIERYRETAEAAEATTERAVEAAKRQAEETAEAARRQAEEVIEERKRQAEREKEILDKRLEAAERQAEREQEILDKRLEALEKFREGFDDLQAAQQAFSESFEQGFDTGGLTEAASDLEAVRERIEELQDSNTLTIEQSNELAELRSREFDLIQDTAREEASAAAAALSSTEQIKSSKEALGDVISAARDRLDEFKDKFGEVAPAAVGEIEAIIRQLELQGEQVRVNESDVEALGLRLESAFRRGERAVESQTEKLREQVDSLGLVGDEAETLGDRLAAAFEKGLPLSEEQLAVFQEQASALQRQREEAAQIAESLARVQESFAGLGEGAAESLAPTTEALALAGEESLAFADNTERGANAVASLVESAPELTTSLEEQVTALSNATPELQRYADQAERGASSVREIADQSLVAAENQESLGLAVESTAAKVRDANGPLAEQGRLLGDIAAALPRVSEGLTKMADDAEASSQRAVAALSEILLILQQIEQQAAAAAAAISALDDLGG